MKHSRHALGRLASSGLLAGVAACGSGPVTGPRADPTPTPGPITRLVAEGSVTGLGINFITTVLIRTDTRGTLEAVVDWTFADDRIAVYWTRTPCSLASFNAGGCTMPAFSNAAATPKPRRLSIPDAEPGEYLLWIGNRGPQQESLAYQVTLTTAGARTRSAAPATGAADVGDYLSLP